MGMSFRMLLEHVVGWGYGGVTNSLFSDPCLEFRPRRKKMHQSAVRQLKSLLEVSESLEAEWSG